MTGHPPVAAAAIVQRPVFEPGSLVDVEQAPRLFDRYPSYAQALEWLTTFVARPHPDLMRTGDVCPRLAPALGRNLLWLVVARTTAAEPDTARATGTHLAELFEALFPDPGQFHAGALLGLFPRVEPARAGGFIDGGHRLLRLSFVERGLMLGEFHPESTVASVRNPALPVMRSPVPMFAVRALSRHDLMFLDRPARSPAERRIALQQYLRHVGDQLPATERARVEIRLRDLNETS